MQASKNRVYPMDDCNEQSRLVPTSWASIPSDDDNTGRKLEGENRRGINTGTYNLQMYRPRSASNQNCPSTSSHEESRDVGTIGKSLPELNRGRRANENMAPYERFLKTAEREIARDIAAEGLNELNKDAVSTGAMKEEEKERVSSVSSEHLDANLRPSNSQVTDSKELTYTSTANPAEIEGQNQEVMLINQGRQKPKYQQENEQVNNQLTRHCSTDRLLPDLASETKLKGELNTALALDKAKNNCWVSPPPDNRLTSSRPVEPTGQSDSIEASCESLSRLRDTRPSVASLENGNEADKNAENFVDKESGESRVKRDIKQYYKMRKKEPGKVMSGKEQHDILEMQERDKTVSKSDENVSERQNSDICIHESHNVHHGDTMEEHDDKDRESPPLFQLNQDEKLLEYFAKLTTSDDFDDTLDFNFIRSVLAKGASVNVADGCGQTILHEVSCAWSVDAAHFLVNQGADVNAQDMFGRTPLHCAAAADYVEMMSFLIGNGADIRAQTSGEEQTPLHYAAKNGAVNCVKLLLAQGADIGSPDFKGRMPLQVAAEHKHSVTARMLLEEGAPAGVSDDSGMSALVPLIRTMPGVAMKALDQFYTVDRLQRKERYYLSFLDKGCGHDATFGESRAQSPLEAVVEQNRLDLIMHPTIQRLIQVKWSYFGRVKAWIQITFNFLLAVTVTTLAVLHPNDASKYYKPLTQNWWRIVLESFAVLLTLNEIRKEILDYFQSHKEHKLWKKWRVANLRRERDFCHPKWPQEKKFVELEIRSTKSKNRSYFHDWWNLIDWLAYIMLIISFVLHFANVSLHLLNTDISSAADERARRSNASSRADLHLTTLGQTSHEFNEIYLRMIAFTLIVIWVRLLQYFRPFQVFGPFVVILSHMISATFKWSFVFAAFYIPYAAAFWILFGGRAENPVEGYETFGKLSYTILRLTLVDDYNFEALAESAPITARILCGSFLFIAVIVLLNLFIALMSDTFQRVYDNARATAAIQRAHFIQSLESTASNKTKQRYRNFIHTKCSPDEVESSGTTGEEDSDKIHERLSNLEEQINELKTLLIERTIHDNVVQDTMSNKLKDVESLLRNFQETSGIPNQPVNAEPKPVRGPRDKQRERREKGRRKSDALPLSREGKARRRNVKKTEDTNARKT